MTFYLGTSGYYYKHWKDTFYKTNDYLSEYAYYFDSLEINNTFYRLPSKESVAKWSSYDLKYCFKISRYFRGFVKNDLKKAKLSFQMQYKSLGVLAKKSTFLLQFDQNTKASIELIDNIRKCIPKKVKFVIEGRNDSWTSNLILEKLTKEKISLVILPKNAIFDMDVRKVMDYVVRTNLVYIRFHGTTKYGGDYSRRILNQWSNIINELLNEGIEVYCFFNNDENAYSVKNALEIADMIN